MKTLKLDKMYDLYIIIFYMTSPKNMSLLCFTNITLTAWHMICVVCSVEELTILTFTSKCKYCLKQNAFLLFLFALVNQFCFENSIIIHCTQTTKRL